MTTDGNAGGRGMRHVAVWCMAISGLVAGAGILWEVARAAPVLPAGAPKTVVKTMPAPPMQTKAEVATVAQTPVECEVWNRERSFADSVESHDAKAFVDHIDANAAFGAGTRAVLHGRAAVVADWKEIVEGKTVKLHWSPAIVTVGGDGTLAISRGPSWMEDLRPGAKAHYRIGEFISTWTKNRDGKWRVLFDSGAAPMHEATADDVAQLAAAVPKSCQMAPR
jgi:ketosteroid isomerase-like protein